MSDLIDRQAAIDALESIGSLDTEADRKYARSVFEALPSAQPEIVRCKDCKHYSQPWYCEAWNNSPGFPAVSDDMFCSMAERRTDERHDISR